MNLEKGELYQLVFSDRIFHVVFDGVEISSSTIKLIFNNNGIATIIDQYDIDDERVKVKPSKWASRDRVVERIAELLLDRTENLQNILSCENAREASKSNPLFSEVIDLAEQEFSNGAFSGFMVECAFNKFKQMARQSASA